MHCTSKGMLIALVSTSFDRLPLSGGRHLQVIRHVHQTLRVHAKASKTKGLKRSEVTESSAALRSRHQITAKLIPGSQQVLDGENQTDYDKTASKMKTAVEWFRKQVAAMETRGSGRVTPDLLNSVMVRLPNSEGAKRLNDVATIGVREGTTLVVTVFEEGHLKHVEKALYAAQLTHIVPQKVDSMTLQIPVPKPTVEGRLSLLSTASKLAEETKVQLRNFEQLSIKKGKYDKRSRELEVFRTLLNQHLSQIEGILTDMKQKIGSK